VPVAVRVNDSAGQCTHQVEVNIDRQPKLKAGQYRTLGYIVSRSILYSDQH